MRRYILLILLVTAWLGCRSEQPDGVVRRFYSARLEGRAGGAGIPVGVELERMKPYLSSRLIKLFIDAENYQQGEWAQRNPDQPARNGNPPVINKPPFVDGDYFSSMFEGARTFTIGDTSAKEQGTWSVRVLFSCGPGVRGSHCRWVDTIIVKREGSRYVIDDVIYGGAGDFNPPGTLSSSLLWREDAHAVQAAPN